MSPSMDFGSSSSKLPRTYDVLINFTGEDIQRKFVSHLDSVISAVGLTTFLHHQNAVIPMHIQKPILNLCRVAIVVFTKTYAQSAWCLHQLQQIIEWHQTYCRHVLPVYYEIEPSDVRLQKGDFGKAFKATAHQTFSEQELEDVMSSWSHALTKAANLFGWDESNYRSDAELVDNIVKTILNLAVLSATKFPVALQSHVEDLIRTIKNKSAQVCTIAICGQGGSGKTTLAKAIYNQLSGTFTEKSFIEDIAQVRQPSSRIHLQERLLLDVLKTKVEIHSVEMGRSVIRDRLFRKRVLIVLDDVDDYFPLVDLRKSGSWLSEGTVIIITKRDEDKLRIHQVDYVFRINLMNANESLELLSWHAFREAKPKEEYRRLAIRVVHQCGGLPLALEVIGSYLYKRTEEIWNRALLRLENNPQYDVQQILRISFDGLCNQMEQDLFLDVCRFFVGKGRAYVTKILNGCGVDADSGIRLLVERSLINVKKNNKLGMHPLIKEMGIQEIGIQEIGIQKMGREIFLESLEKEKELWFPDATYVLTDNTGTEALNILSSVRREPSRLLKLDEDSEYLPPKLRWISLHGFSSAHLASGYNVHFAVAIDLKHSFIRFFWKPQVLMWLKVLKLSHIMYLIETPDFSRLPSLEQLILKDCPRLRKVHQSIECLRYLTLLKLKDCSSLSNLPREIYKLKSLKTLILSGCSKIHPWEKDIVRMESLISLITEYTIVKQVPLSIASSKNIGYISLRGFEGLPHNLFPSIFLYWMLPTTNPLSYIHSFCTDMEDNIWDDIAPLLSTLANLRSVSVQCDSEFQLSKQVETILVEYGLRTTQTGISKHHLRSSLIGFGRYNEFFNTVSNSIYEVSASNESWDVCLPGDNDPYWLAHKGEGHSVSFTVPPDRDMKGIALCVVYLSTPEIVTAECLRSVLIVNYTKCTVQIHKHDTVISFSDIHWEGIMSNLEFGDKVEMFVSCVHGSVVKNTAVYLIYGESNDLEKERAPKKNSLVRFIKKIVM